MLVLALLACQTHLADLAPFPEPIDSDPHGWTELSGEVLFFARRPGWLQLRSTPGAQADSELIFEWADGSPPSWSIEERPGMTPVGAGAAFWIGGQNHELWFTDGTTGGTFPLVEEEELGAFSALYQPPELVEHEGELYFFVEDRLWKTNGTPEGSEVFAQFDDSDLLALEAFGDDLAILIQGPNGNVNLGRLTTPGPNQEVLASFAPLSIPLPAELTAHGDRLYFSAASGGVGSEYELWTSDGTVAGTQQVIDLNGTAAASPENLIGAGTSMFFTARKGFQRTLWRTEGTPESTLELFDSTVTELQPLGDRVAFLGTSGSNRVLGVSDGTLEGTSSIQIPPTGVPASSPEALTTGGGLAYFESFVFETLTSVPGRLLWVSDFTPEGTGVLSQSFIPEEASTEVLQGAYSKAMDKTFAKDRLYFAGWDPIAGREPWSSTGTAESTRLIEDLTPGSQTQNAFPVRLARFGDQLYFVADKAPAGTDFLVEAEGQSPQSLAVSGIAGGSTTAPGVTVEDTFFFGYGAQLWRTLGLPENTKKIIDFKQPSKFVPPHIVGFVPGVDRVFFAVEDPEISLIDLWTCDPATESLAMLFSGVDDPSSMLFAEGRLYFAGSTFASGTEPWSTDGTPGGTGQIADLVAGPASSDPHEFTHHGDSVLFAIGPESGDASMVWRVDPTGPSAEVALNLELPASGRVVRLESFGDTLLIFTTSEPLPGGEDDTQLDLWASHGDLSEVEHLGTYPAFDWNGDLEFTAAGPDRAYFFAPRAEDGGNLWLWTTGGTASTTLPVSAFPESTLGHTANDQIKVLQVASGTTQLFFSARTDDRGAELWTSDGSQGGTFRVTESLNPGPWGTHPGPGVRVEDRYYFPGDHPEFGHEILYVLLSELGVAVAEVRGIGCPGSSGAVPSIEFQGPPTLGGQTSVAVTKAAPQTLALLFLGGEVELRTQDGCTFWLGQPWSILSATTTGQGQADLAIPIPNDPSLLGHPAYLQWVIADTGGALAGSFALSAALEFVLTQ